MGCAQLPPTRSGPFVVTSHPPPLAREAPWGASATTVQDATARQGKSRMRLSVATTGVALRVAVLVLGVSRVAAYATVLQELQSVAFAGPVETDLDATLPVPPHQRLSNWTNAASYSAFVDSLAEPGVIPVLPAHSVMRHVLDHEWLITGVAVELGVFLGTSLTSIASAYPDRTVFGFDSFLGLPEHWSRGDTEQFAAGAFSIGGAVPLLPHDNVILVPGWFNTTLPWFAASLGSAGIRIALLHVDCDLYSSTRLALEVLAPMLRRGTVVVFDELVNYPGYHNHELRALFEVLAGKFAVEWIGKVQSPFDPQPVTDTGGIGQAVAARLW